MNIVGAAGALCSTPRDLVRWIRALAAGQVVSREAFSMMSTPVRLPDGSASATAYGLSRGRLGEFDVIQQAGGINGFSAFVAHYPQENLTIAVTTNGATSANRVQQQIARTMLGIPDPPNK
jgi:CubicO group peptidase (beta-lactamase class C family)